MSHYFISTCPCGEAEFLIDPAKVPEDGIYARCNRCPRVFLVEHPVTPAQAWEAEPEDMVEPEEEGEPSGDGDAGWGTGAAAAVTLAEAGGEEVAAGEETFVELEVPEASPSDEREMWGLPSEGAPEADAPDSEEVGAGDPWELPVAEGAIREDPAPSPRETGAWETGAEVVPPVVDEPEEEGAGVEEGAPEEWAVGGWEGEGRWEEAAAAPEEEPPFDGYFEAVFTAQGLDDASAVQVDADPGFGPAHLQEEPPEPIPTLPPATSETGEREPVIRETPLGSLAPPVFGRGDPHEKARRLARVLVSDMVTYHRDRHHRALEAGTLADDFEEEIQKSWEEYVIQVGRETAAGTPYFTEALNEILARGEQLF